MIMVLVMVTLFQHAYTSYVLEGSLQGKWHDSGTSFNKQRYVNDMPQGYVTSEWVSNSFLRLIDANQAVANNLAARINSNGDSVEMIIYVFSSLFILLSALVVVLYRRAQLTLQQLRKLNGIIGLDSPIQVQLASTMRLNSQ